MSKTTPAAFNATLATTLALIDQFSGSLNAAAATTTTTSPDTGTPSPLLLLAAAAKSLRAQVTKLSLLALTRPFTASAVATTLQSVNDAVLPSLVTATLLVDAAAAAAAAADFIPSFATACRNATQTVLKNLRALVVLVEAAGSRADGTDGQDGKEDTKSAITEATGRVWQDCDALVALADGGVAGFVVTRANQWLDLMKDAVAELQDWDPEDDDDLFGDAGSDDGNDDGDDEDENAKDSATISAGVKEQALKVLSRIPQSVHVVVKQRLEKLRPQQQHQLSWLDPALTRLGNISELIDESAEAIYLGNPELCLKKAGEARAVTIELVQGALAGGQTGQAGQSQEDKYVKRALDWIIQSPGTQT